MLGACSGRVALPQVRRFQSAAAIGAHRLKDARSPKRSLEVLPRGLASEAGCAATVPSTELALPTLGCR